MPMIKSPTAWMLRQDGEAFPVIQHLYGSLECVEETLYAGEWLYKHTRISATQQLVLKLVAAYGKSLHPQGDVVDNLRQSIREKPYIFLTLDFVEKIAAQLPMAEPSSLERLNRQVTEKLNQEFLRSDALRVRTLPRGFAWLDTGTHDSLAEASIYVEVLEKRQGLKIACLEGIAYRQGWIDRQRMEELAQPMLKNQYGRYLMKVIDELDRTGLQNLD